MLSEKELNNAQFSATNKDYYQIWEELLDLAGKISYRWDPTSTNESDPGIVLLKVLAALGDKLNFNIDVNIQEAFMPSAAQYSSMQKLCQALGYNMKYYQSAITDVTISYMGEETLTGIYTLPKFSVITNIDKDVNYVTMAPTSFSADSLTQTVTCIEGQLVQCESNNNGVITTDQLDDNNRYYLPEAQIAENGIFIYRITDSVSSERWEKVDNLNSEGFESLVYSVFYDSALGRPYIKFPDDIGQIIGDGLEIYYIRTSGENGNISAKVLTTLESGPVETNSGTELDAENFVVLNLNAATNGTNIETLDNAYENFKKTVGTFETLVTCRDYMNKIYSLLSDKNINYVSNAIVSDIRSDINRAITICSFSDKGITYLEQSIKDSTTGENLINHFDLVLYPFKNLTGLNTKEEYDNSFKYSADNVTEILAELEDTKTISHNIVLPKNNEIVAIKNYLKLTAKITTNTKINTVEEYAIIENIKTALYKNFNMRKLDFGTEIPFDSILETIEKADNNIKNVALEEPTLYTKFTCTNGKEYDCASVVLSNSENTSEYIATFPGRELYNKLALRNVLAGRIELFNYDTSFNFSLNETASTIQNTGGTVETPGGIPVIIPPASTKTTAEDGTVNTSENTKTIVKIEPQCVIPMTDNSSYQLTSNEAIKFRAPNFTTIKTYPAYINYFLKLASTIVSDAVPATFQTYLACLDANNHNTSWADLKNYYLEQDFELASVSVKDLKIIGAASKIKTAYGALWNNSQGNGDSENITDSWVTNLSSENDNTKYYYIALNAETFNTWLSYFKAKGITTYYIVNNHSTNTIGYLVDTRLNKYAQRTTWNSSSTKSNTTPLLLYYVPVTYAADSDMVINGKATVDGLGKSATVNAIKKNTEYALKEGEYLLINYTPSSSDGNEESKPENLIYGPGTIIRPNFEIVDSSTRKTNIIKYNITSGFDFTNNGKLADGRTIEVQEPEGMWSLAADEQIEIRKEVKVELKKSSWLYWELKDVNKVNNALKTNRIAGENGSYGSYTLQDNEYIFYTDINKTDMAYYGSGTEVQYTMETDLFTEIAEHISLEDILTNGLNAVPWRRIDFTDDRKLTFREFQYITLSEGDHIVSVDFVRDGVSEISTNWEPVEECKYISGGAENSLPIISTAAAINWEVRSYLYLNTGPNLIQNLTANDKIKIYYNDSTPTAPAFVLSGTSTKPLSIQTSTPCIVALDSIDTAVTAYDTLGNEININNFQIKCFEQTQLGIYKAQDANNMSLDSLISVHNFGDYWTSIPFKNFENPIAGLTDKSYMPLSCAFDKDKNFGIIMIYYVADPTNSDTGLSNEGAFLTTTDGVELSIFNNNEAWWADYTVEVSGIPTRYYLKAGMNIIKIPEPCTVKLYSGMNTSQSIIMSDLNMVDKINPLALKLLDYQDVYNHNKYQTISTTNLKAALGNGTNTTKRYIAEYKAANGSSYYLYYNLGELNTSMINNTFSYFEEKPSTTTTSLESQVLEQLKELDPESKFYYNCPIEPGLAIDLDKSLINTSDRELLSDPLTWYLPNNINNNFVISEIDSNYLSTGIKISRTSKK